MAQWVFLGWNAQTFLFLSFRASDLNLSLPNEIWVVVSNILHFHPHVGKIPILTNIFQKGWFNHQLEIFYMESS